MNEVIDMGDKAIIGIKEDANDDTSAVNYKQLKTLTQTLMNLINENNRLVKELNMSSSYYELFEYYFDCLNSCTFNVNQTSSGPFIQKINNKLVLHNAVDLNNFNIKNGLNLLGSTIHLDKTYNQNSNFTMFITFKHDTNKNKDHFFGFGSIQNDSFYIIPPFAKVRTGNFYLNKTAQNQTVKTLLSNYRNKQIMLWFAKSGNFYEVNICDNGGLISRTFTPISFTATKILIGMDYYVQRVGFSPNYYNVDGKEFHRILFLEKSRGTFFQ